MFFGSALLSKVLLQDIIWIQDVTHSLMFTWLGTVKNDRCILFIVLGIFNNAG